MSKEFHNIEVEVGEKVFTITEPHPSEWQRQVVIEELASALPKLQQEKPETPRFFTTPTRDIVGDLVRRKRLKLIADGESDNKQSIPTYEKNFTRISLLWDGYLPLDSELIEDHLLTFKGETRRTRRNEWDYLNQLYRHAKRHFDLPYNPMEVIPRPQAVKSDPNPIRSWALISELIKIPESTQEMAFIHLLLGHGWRPCEVLRVTAKDVKSVEDGLIWCHGKQREEYAPLLPETLELLLELSKNLVDSEPVFRARRVRGGIHEPLRENGLRKLVNSWYKQVGITGHKLYDLRDTFSQKVYDAGCDEFIAERLMRHKIPGTGDRYRKYPKDKLVQALLTYSPIRLLQRRDEESEFNSPPSPP